MTFLTTFLTATAFGAGVVLGLGLGLIALVKFADWLDGDDAK